MNYNTMFLYDFETCSASAEKTQPVQVAGLAVHGRSLNIIPGSEFSCLMKPLYGEEAKAEEVDELQDGAIKVHGKTHEILSDAPNIESVIKNFCEHINQYNWKGNNWGKPIPVHYNGTNFDTVILKRYCEKFKIDYPFHPIHKVDMMDHMFALFENDKSIKSLSLDNLVRGHFGYKDPEGMAAHDAMADVKLLHELFKRYMNLIRKLNKTTTFEGSMA